MKNKGLFVVLTGLLSLSLIAGSYLLAGKKEITIKGSTTVLPIAQACAEAYMHKYEDVDISVQGGGSGVGIASVMDGTADIGDASRPAKDKEIAKAKENGIELYQNVIAKDGIAIIVHPSNPINEITREQAKAIYTGKITNWKELGGKDAEIVVVNRDSASGTFETFNEIVLKKEKVFPSALQKMSNRGVADTVTVTELAIGYIGMGYITPKVKALVVEGVKPTKENVVDGTYPIARDLYMYTNGKPKGVVASFIGFVLSKDGQKLVEQEGFVSILK